MKGSENNVPRVPSVAIDQPEKRISQSRRTHDSPFLLVIDYSNLPAVFSPKIMKEMKKQKQDGARILALIPPPVYPLILVAFAYF